MSDDLTPKGGITPAILTQLLKELEMPNPLATDGGLDKISLGERESNKLRQKTPEQHLLDDVRRHDPAVSVVHMNGAQTIHIGPEQKHTLFTYGLCGCTAALLLSHKPDGSSVATMTHYDPLHRRISPLIIEREVSQHHKDLPEGTHHSLIIVSPGEYIDVDEKWELQIKDKSMVDPLIDAAKRRLRDVTIGVKVCPYSESLEHGQSTGFIVNFAPQGSDRINYEAHGRALVRCLFNITPKIFEFEMRKSAMPSRVAVCWQETSCPQGLRDPL